MSRRRLGSWVAGLTVVGALVVTACGGNKNNEASGMAAESASASPAAAVPESAATTSPTAAAAATPTDPQIVQIVLSANAGDSVRGKLAESRAANAEVKAFGRLMVVDHSRLNKQATALAKKLNVTPQPSAADSDLVNKVQGMTQGLQGKSGADFDSTYIDQEVAIHQLVETDLDSTLIPAAQNAELKKALQSARAVVDGHLKRVQEIQKKVTK